MHINEDTLNHDQIIMHRIHKALSNHMDIKYLVEGESIPGKNGLFIFQDVKSPARLLASITKTKIDFKIEKFKEKDIDTVQNAFLKTFNLQLNLVDKVLSTYLDAAKNLAGTGIITLSETHTNHYMGNILSYISFDKGYQISVINDIRHFGIITFNSGYRKNLRYRENINQLLMSQFQFYYDTDKNIKPMAIIKVLFDQQYEINYIVDIYNQKIYASKNILNACSYEDLISNSRPILEQDLATEMHNKFISRLVPVIKKRYGIKKQDIDLTNKEMRDRYIALLLMESV
jgi:hypothetical protein